MIVGEVTFLMIPVVMHEHYNYGHVISLPTSDLGQNCITADCWVNKRQNSTKKYEKTGCGRIPSYLTIMYQAHRQFRVGYGRIMGHAVA
jgi:hypothetical protein